jgi:hypothetical protein
VISWAREVENVDMVFGWVISFTFTKNNKVLEGKENRKFYS